MLTAPRRTDAGRLDHPQRDTLVVSVGNYVSAALGNYVSDKGLNLGKSVNADSQMGERAEAVGFGRLVDIAERAQVAQVQAELAAATSTTTSCARPTPRTAGEPPLPVVVSGGG